MENIYFRSFFSRMGIIIYIYIWIVKYILYKSL